MTLKRLTILAASLGAAYLAYQRRDQLKTGLANAQTSLKEGQDSLHSLQGKVETLNQKVSQAQDLTKDFNYKLRVFQQESQPHLQAIQTIINKYKTEDK